MNELQDRINIKEENNDDLEIDILELLFFFRTKLLPIISLFLIGAAVAGLITYYLITPKYEATSKLYMVSASSDSVVDLTDLNLGTSLSEDYAELLYIRPIFEEIIKEQKLNYTYEELQSMVTIEPIGETRILAITTTSTDAKEAQTVSNELADKAVTYLPKLMETDAPNIAECAIYPEEPCSPSLVKNTAIGGVLGLVLALIIFTIIFVTDDTLKSAEDVESAFGVMPLTVIPEGDIEEISDKAEKELHRKRSKHRRKK